MCFWTISIQWTLPVLNKMKPSRHWSFWVQYKLFSIIKIPITEKYLLCSRLWWENDILFLLIISICPFKSQHISNADSSGWSLELGSNQGNEVIMCKFWDYTETTSQVIFLFSVHKQKLRTFHKSIEIFVYLSWLFNLFWVDFMNLMEKLEITSPA